MLVFILVGLEVLGLSNASPSHRIHGGVDAPPAHAPHMVAMLHEGARVRVVCGGSIVSKSHVLTAAHCLTPFIEHDRLSPSLHGRVGSNIWHSGGTVVHFKSHYIHPEWDEDIIKYDVGIVTLNKKLVLSETVAIIGLEFGWVGDGELTSVTGWGTTWPRFEEDAVHLAPTPDLLQLIYVFTLIPQKCNKIIQSDPEWAARAPPLDPKVEICTLHSVGYGMCNGDSGSALVLVSTSKLIGLVSWGFPCARGAPDFHVRLSSSIEKFLRPILETCPSFKS